MLSQQQIQSGALPPLPKKSLGSVSVTQTTDLSFQGYAIERPGQSNKANSAASKDSNNSQSETASKKRPKYREQPQSFNGQVQNGNTYAYPQLPLNAQPNAAEVEKQHALKKQIQAKRKLAMQQRLRTPDAVAGRKHIEIQTTLYLEELSDKVPEAYAATQTDAFIDRAPSPLYIPKKTGVDATTQIIEGELFDFDFEVTPITEALVGKTLEQALLEVVEEDELSMLRQYRQAFEERRSAELTEVKRLESLEKRRTEEKERRLNEQLRVQYEKEQAAEKIAARAFAQSYLRNLIPTVLDELADTGFVYNTIEKEVTHLFLPWLSNSVEQKLERTRTARNIVDNLVLNAIRIRQEQYEKARTIPEPVQEAQDTPADVEQVLVSAEDSSSAEQQPEAALLETGEEQPAIAAEASLDQPDAKVEAAPVTEAPSGTEAVPVTEAAPVTEAVPVTEEAPSEETQQESPSAEVQQESNNENPEPVA